MSDARLGNPLVLGEYIDSILESLEPVNQARRRRLMRLLLNKESLAFAELARLLPDPPSQVARDVLQLSKERLVRLAPAGGETTRVSLTEIGKQKALSPA